MARGARVVAIVGTAWSVHDATRGGKWIGGFAVTARGARNAVAAVGTNVTVVGHTVAVGDGVGAVEVLHWLVVVAVASVAVAVDDARTNTTRSQGNGSARYGGRSARLQWRWRLWGRRRWSGRRRARTWRRRRGRRRWRRRRWTRRRGWRGSAALGRGRARAGQHLKVGGTAFGAVALVKVGGAVGARTRFAQGNARAARGRATIGSRSTQARARRLQPGSGARVRAARILECRGRLVVGVAVVDGRIVGNVWVVGPAAAAARGHAAIEERIGQRRHADVAVRATKVGVLGHLSNDGGDGRRRVARAVGRRRRRRRGRWRRWRRWRWRGWWR